MKLVTELIEFEHTDRTVPQDGLRGLEHLGELLGSLRADVENHVVGLVHAVLAEAAEVTDGAVDVALAEAVGAIDHTVVDGQLGTDKGAV